MSGVTLEINLIDELLAEQQRLTPVERFAQRQKHAGLPAQARYYRDLIPSARPGRGQQYAFAVELDVCTGCKACVSACHSLNGLDENETWRDVGLITGSGDGGKPYLQTVTTACHHCVEPGCLEGCPVLAYDKDPETGIVRHLDDQCIGCQYCTMKCPYDVPKFSPRLGIVRKCDMCTDRLAVGEAPACVQACPHEAISIRLVDTAEVTATAKPGTRVIPGAFDSSYTKPTTRYYSSKRVPENAEPADAHALRLEHAHWPLIIMLLLTQMAAGIFLVITAIAAFAGASSPHLGPLAALGVVALQSGLAASVFHLGRPLGAWRFFLGLRTSWMSREILAFGVFAATALVATGVCWTLPAPSLGLAGLAGAAAVGLLAVFTSVMIYADTRRAFWTLPITAIRFYGATILLGAAAVAAGLNWLDFLGAANLGSSFRMATLLAMAAHGLLVGWEIWSASRALHEPSSLMHRSEKTISLFLPWLRPAGIALFVLGICSSVMAIVSSGLISAIAITMALAAMLGSRVLERFSFFAAVSAPRMPGGV